MTNVCRHAKPARSLLFVAALIFLALNSRVASAASPSSDINVEINRAQGSSFIKFNFGQPIKVAWFSLTAPDRLVIDVSDVVIAEVTKNIAVDTSIIHQVRMAQFSTDPEVVRIVIDLKKPVRLGVNANETLGTVTVSESAGEKSFPQVQVSRSLEWIRIKIPFEIIPQYTQPVANAAGVAIDFPGYASGGEKRSEINDGIVEAVSVKPFGASTRLQIETLLPARTEIYRDGNSLVISINQYSLNGRKICIDPGHGGKDPGAQSRDRRTNEKDLVLDIGLRLRSLLERAGAEVIMTRSDDTFIPLDERAAIANRNSVDTFVSIHINALENHGAKLSVRGTQMYYRGEKSYPLGLTMQQNLSGILGIGDFGVIDANYLVLRKTVMEAVLAEVAYISHPADLELLKNETFRENAARGLFNGLEAHFGGTGYALAPMGLPSSLMANLPKSPRRTNYANSTRVKSQKGKIVTENNGVAAGSAPSDQPRNYVERALPAEETR